jgi:hypothetical protein
LVIVLTVSAVILTLSRPLSPLWTVLILLALAALMGGRHARDFVRRRQGRSALLAIVLAVVLSLCWLVTQHPLDVFPNGIQVKGLSDSGILRADVGQTEYLFKQMVGVLGWLDTYLPLITYLFWFVAIGTTAMLALLVARAREAAVLALLVTAVLIIPIVLNYSQARSVGLTWQGRYTLPLAVGVPLLAMALIDGSTAFRQVRDRITAFLLVGVFVAQVGAFGATVRRYTVGDQGPLLFWLGRWHPAPGTLVTCLWYFMVLAVFVAFLWRFSSPSLSDRPG